MHAQLAAWCTDDHVFTRVDWGGRYSFAPAVPEKQMERTLIRKKPNVDKGRPSVAAARLNTSKSKLVLAACATVWQKCQHQNSLYLQAGHGHGMRCWQDGMRQKGALLHD